MRESENWVEKLYWGNLRDSEKEVERLRWEYLKRSELYRKFCIWKRNNTKESSLGRKVKNEEYDEVNYYEGDDIPVVKMTDCGHLFQFFGYIHSSTFEEFWKNKVDWDARYLNLKGKTENNWLGEVREYDIRKDIDPVISYFLKKRHGGSATELKNWLTECFRDWPFSPKICLIFDQPTTFRQYNKTLKAIGRILKKKTDRKRFVKEELERYLSVYDMRTKIPPVPYREIHTQLHPKIEYSENTRRSCISDFNKAKKIIQNVEKGMYFYW